MGRPGKKAQRLGLSANTASKFHEIESQVQPGTSAAVLSELPHGFDVTAPESSYRSLVPMSHRKRFAQFFTPEPVAQFMIDWALETKPSTVLDPSVGPGVFLRLAQKAHSNVQMTGIDIDPVALSAASRSLHPTDLSLHLNDFLTWSNLGTFDAIVSNPPYLRHHDMHYEQNIFAEIGTRAGVRLSKLSNMYVLFILEICRRLSPGGRAAVIVPGEWTNANFGMALKRFLIEHGYLHSLVYFSNLSEQFEDALTTASILLIEKTDNNLRKAKVNTYFVEHVAPMSALREAVWKTQSGQNIIHQAFDSADLVGLEKWDKVLRGGLAKSLPGFIPLGNFAKSRRGIATGANDFFHVPLATVKSEAIRSENTKPCIGRSEQVVGLVFHRHDFETLESACARTRLLDLPVVLSDSEKRYVEKGAADGLHERFLLAARKPWYSMEKRPPAPIWAAVFGRSNLRFVFNDANVSNLTTFHCIYPERTDALFCRALVACLNSRVVQDMAEHQRRVYGGGLLKFEPKDLLSIQVPALMDAPTEVLEELAATTEQLDVCMRKHGELSVQLLDHLDALVMRAASMAKSATLF